MKAFLKAASASLFLASVITVAGCGGDAVEPGPDTSLAAIDTSTAVTDNMAMAELQSGEGNNIQGTVQFQQEPGGYLLTGTITGLPEGEHGIHIHQNGSCEAADSDDPDSDPEPFGAAGPHWAGMPDAGHGAPEDSLGMRHAGDLGNIQGQGDTTTLNVRVNVDMPMDSLLNKALVIHANRDDLESDPSGNSGARIACGVIMAGGSAMPADTTMAGSPTASR